MMAVPLLVRWVAVLETSITLSWGDDHWPPRADR